MKRKLNIAVLAISRFRNILVRLFLWSEIAVRKAGGITPKFATEATMDSFMRVMCGLNDVVLHDYISFIRGADGWVIFPCEHGGTVERLHVVGRWYKETYDSLDLEDDTTKEEGSGET